MSESEHRVDQQLRDSIYMDHLGKVKRYIDYGANIDCYDINGWTPLGIAAYRANIDISEYLLSLGADVNGYRKSDGRPPLSLTSDIGLAKLLIDKNAKLDLPDFEGNTPLISAIKRKDESMVILLVTSKAKINVCNLRGYTPLAVAVEENAKNIVQILLEENADVKKFERNGKLPLMVALLNENLDLLKYLLDNGGDANSTDSAGSSLLSIAITYYKRNITFYREAIKSLVATGANPNNADANDNTMLMTVIKYQDEDLVKFLIEHGIDVCKSNKTGKTPLSVAVETGNVNLATHLLDNGAELTIQTAFLAAIQRHNLDMVKLLKERGDSVSYTYSNGASCFAIAASALHLPHIAQYLIENGAVATDKELLCKVVESENFKLVKCAVEKGANVNQIDGDGNSALNIAASKFCFQIVKYLIDSGANIDHAKDELQNFAAVNEDFESYLQSLKKVVPGTSDEEKI